MSKGKFIKNMNNKFWAGNLVKHLKYVKGIQNRKVQNGDSCQNKAKPS